MILRAFLEEFPRLVYYVLLVELINYHAINNLNGDRKRFRNTYPSIGHPASKKPKKKQLML